MTEKNRPDILVNGKENKDRIWNGDNMKKIIKRIVIIVVVLIAFIALTAGAIKLFSDHTEVAEGTYKVQNNTHYPDAYLVVNDGKAQFFNIDLNALYKDDIATYYIDYLKTNNPQLSGEEEKEVRDAIDLNKMFCESEFPLDYDPEKSNFIDEEGIAHYNFGWVTEMSYLSYEYDWKKETITLDRGPRVIFKREKI